MQDLGDSSDPVGRDLPSHRQRRTKALRGPEGERKEPSRRRWRGSWAIGRLVFVLLDPDYARKKRHNNRPQLANRKCPPPFGKIYWPYIEGLCI